MMADHLSASQLKKHADCPRQWWFRYESDEEPEESDTRYLDLGSAVHDALEEALSEHRDEPDLLDRAEAAYSSWASKHGVPADMVDDGLDYVRTAIEYYLGEHPEVYDIEEKVTLHVDQPGIDEEFIGYMDVATTDAIWDWKTGSVRDDTPAKEKLQGGVYAGAYLAKYGHSPEEIRFIYLKEGKVRKLTPEQDIAGAVRDETLRLLRNKEKGEFPTKPGEKCHWCDYEPVCPKNGEGLPGTNFDWDDWTRL